MKSIAIPSFSVASNLCSEIYNVPDVSTVFKGFTDSTSVANRARNEIIEVAPKEYVSFIKAYQAYHDLVTI
jgi:hypothetical protein